MYEVTMADDSACVPFTAEDIKYHRVNLLRQIAFRAAIVGILLTIAYLAPSVRGWMIMLAFIYFCLVMLCSDLTIKEAYLLDKPLNDREVRQLYRLAQDYPPIRAMLEAVRESGRSVALCDLYNARQWLGDRAAERMDQMRKEIYEGPNATASADS